jgi:hemerythrin-like domain-containing protein
MTSRNVLPANHKTLQSGNGKWFMPTIELIPDTLLDEPLEYMFADHFRERVVLATLQHFTEEASASRADSDTIAKYLTRDLVLHHADEEEDLFPFVRLRALPEDELGTLLARLGEDHHRSKAMVEDIIAALMQHPAKKAVYLSTSICRLIQSYVVGENRHLAVENGVLLAIARIRLTPKDLKAIGRGMKARRGVIH